MNKRRRHRAKRAHRHYKAKLLAFSRMEATLRLQWQRVGFVGQDNIRKMLRESEAWWRTHPADRTACHAHELRQRAAEASIAMGVQWSFVNDAERSVLDGYKIREAFGMTDRWMRR
jgi:hypothetical protein